MARESDVQGFISQVVNIAPGGTNAVLISPISGQVAQTLKYGSGGSLEIIPAPYAVGGYASSFGGSQIVYSGYTSLGGGYSIGLGGSGVISATLAAAPGTGYLLGTAEVFSFGGAARYYLLATGATVTAYLLRGVGQGF